MITAPLINFVILSTMLFCIGVCGFFLNRRNLIILLMSIELILLAANINFVAFSYFNNDALGQLFVIFSLTVAAAEAAIGLAILITYYRIKGNIKMDEINLLKG